MHFNKLLSKHFLKKKLYLLLNIKNMNSLESSILLCNNQCLAQDRSRDLTTHDKFANRNGF